MITPITRPVNEEPRWKGSMIEWFRLIEVSSVGLFVGRVVGVQIGRAGAKSELA